MVAGLRRRVQAAAPTFLTKHPDTRKRWSVLWKSWDTFSSTSLGRQLVVGLWGLGHTCHLTHAGMRSFQHDLIYMIWIQLMVLICRLDVTHVDGVMSQRLPVSNGKCIPGRDCLPVVVARIVGLETQYCLSYDWHVLVIPQLLDGWMDLHHLRNWWNFYGGPSTRTTLAGMWGLEHTCRLTHAGVHSNMIPFTWFESSLWCL